MLILMQYLKSINMQTINDVAAFLDLAFMCTTAIFATGILAMYLTGGLD
jgi:hypothetical protein